MRSAGLFAVVLAMTVQVNFAQEAAKPTDDPSPAKTVSPLRKLLDESLTWDELYLDENSTTPMTVRVAMRWANNIRGSDAGMTLLFLKDGRPEAVCSVYPWEKNLIHEFDSLSRGKLIGKRDGERAWTPSKPGVVFHTIPEAAAPGETPVMRLREMKALAAEFSSTMLGWRADKGDREDLRLLPQPLYRYESKRTDVVDGAVFAFVQGTDPESLLLIEAFHNGKRLEWQFAFARNTSGELEGRHREKVVWHADRFPVSTDSKSVHFNLLEPLPIDVLNDLKQERSP